MANHLWQSTIFAAMAALLALALRNHQARVRHWLWMVASVKFLIPFALLIALFGAENLLAGRRFWRVVTIGLFVSVGIQGLLVALQR